MTGEFRYGRFSKLAGISPRNAIIEFFIGGKDIDYALGNVSKFLKINRATVYNVVEELIKEKLIIPSRLIGRTQLYKWNQDGVKAQSLTEMYNIAIKCEE